MPAWFSKDGQTQAHEQPNSNSNSNSNPSQPPPSLAARMFKEQSWLNSIKNSTPSASMSASMSGRGSTNTSTSTSTSTTNTHLTITQSHGHPSSQINLSRHFLRKSSLKHDFDKLKLNSNTNTIPIPIPKPKPKPKQRVTEAHLTRSLPMPELNKKNLLQLNNPINQLNNPSLHILHNNSHPQNFLSLPPDPSPLHSPQYSNLTDPSPAPHRNPFRSTLIRPRSPLPPPPPPPPDVDSISLSLPTRLEELATANEDGLLDDEDYRLLRQGLFDQIDTANQHAQLLLDQSPNQSPPPPPPLSPHAHAIVSLHHLPQNGYPEGYLPKQASHSLRPPSTGGTSRGLPSLAGRSTRSTRSTASFLNLIFRRHSRPGSTAPSEAGSSTAGARDSNPPPNCASPGRAAVVRVRSQLHLRGPGTRQEWSASAVRREISDLEYECARLLETFNDMERAAAARHRAVPSANGPLDGRKVALDELLRLSKGGRTPDRPQPRPASFLAPLASASSLRPQLASTVQSGSLGFSETNLKSNRDDPDGEEGFEREIEEIREKKEKVRARYDERLEFLRAKLRGAVIREQSRGS